MPHGWNNLASSILQIKSTIQDYSDVNYSAGVDIRRSCSSSIYVNNNNVTHNTQCQGYPELGSTGIHQVDRLCQ